MDSKPTVTAPDLTLTRDTWSKDELCRIAQTDDLHISPFREDGRTYGTPTWIWSVVVDGNLYVRAYNGTSSRWYQAALRQKAGRITAAGLTKEVAFEPVEGPINDRIDDAYRAKYKSSPYLKPMIGTGARAATARILAHVGMAALVSHSDDAGRQWRHRAPQAPGLRRRARRGHCGRDRVRCYGGHGAARIRLER